MREVRERNGPAARITRTTHWPGHGMEAAVWSDQMAAAPEGSWSWLGSSGDPLGAAIPTGWPRTVP